jgi:carbonic anhydrase
MHHSKVGIINSDQALKQLIAGNKRYVASRQLHPNQSHQRRTELSNAQQPFAVILGCADSRVPPEVIFDSGLGDLFVVRIAGHVMNDFVLGSIEYAANHLHAPLIMVLGHSKCGSIQAAISGVGVVGHISCVIEAIQPALYEAQGQPGDLVNNAARANTKIITEQLKCSKPVLSTLVRQGKLKVIPAFYDLDTGLVEILSD